MDYIVLSVCLLLRSQSKVAPNPITGNLELMPLTFLEKGKKYGITAAILFVALCISVGSMLSMYALRDHIRDNYSTNTIILLIPQVSSFLKCERVWILCCFCALVQAISQSSIARVLVLQALVIRYCSNVTVPFVTSLYSCLEDVPVQIVTLI